MLLLLDNASDAAQVRPLLPGTGECVVVVTSRNPLAGLVAREGAARLELEVLPPEQAVDLLRGLIGARVPITRGGGGAGRLLLRAATGAAGSRRARRVPSLAAAVEAGQPASRSEASGGLAGRGR